uniref:Ig-like domain-containing protein n=1 Tax=Oryzias sinensis TaxID=183150 RepID=A0A8C7WTR1_9TELE
EQPAVYVRQSPGLAAAQLGESVNFQCLMISKNEENDITCPGNQNVHWFRSASGSSHPGVICTPANLNNQTAGKSCVYHLTKTLNDSSDAGIYYCAVAMCGEILFGNGTRVEIGKYSGMFFSNLDLYWVLVDIKAVNPCAILGALTLGVRSSRPTRQCNSLLNNVLSLVAKLDPLVPVLGGLLVCCVTICVLLFSCLYQRTPAELQKG